jgi:hypothetical protein
VLRAAVYIRARIHEHGITARFVRHHRSNRGTLYTFDAFEQERCRDHHRAGMPRRKRRLRLSAFDELVADDKGRVPLFAERFHWVIGHFDDLRGVMNREPSAHGHIVSADRRQLCPNPFFVADKENISLVRGRGLGEFDRAAHNGGGCEITPHSIYGDRSHRIYGSIRQWLRQ